MKILTHKYVIEIFNNGRFCWKNHGWIEKGIDDYRKQAAFDFILILFLFMCVYFK